MTDREIVAIAGAAAMAIGCLMYLMCYVTANIVVGTEFEYQRPRDRFEWVLAVGCTLGLALMAGGTLAFFAAAP